jgi:CSLREA domain-containing protein
MADGNRFGKRKKSTRWMRAKSSLLDWRARWQAAGRPDRPLRMEPLEDRRLLATFTVTNPFDLDPDGAVYFGSLRYYVEQANLADDFDTIIFDEEVFKDSGNFIQLNSSADPDVAGELVIGGDDGGSLKILGPGPGKLTISAAPGWRIFSVDNKDDDTRISATIGGVTLTGGNGNGSDDGTDGKGGAIYNKESLTILESVITGNSANNGGGIFTDFGRLTVKRSLFTNNTAFSDGGGIQIGAEDESGERNPSVEITNSTFSGNLALSTEPYYGYGGAIFARDGGMSIAHSTISGNTATGGSGIASWGNPPDTGQGTPPQNVISEFGHSILYNNGTADIAVVGTSGEVDENDTPIPLSSSTRTTGYNIVGNAGPLVELNPDFDLEGVDPILSSLGDFGGSTAVFMPELSSPAIDAGDPEILFADAEQRGRHFARIADMGGGSIIDIGAVEVQEGQFLVDVLIDETDAQFTDIVNNYFLNDPYLASGDFALREAIDFSEKNPLVDTISFSTSLPYEEDLNPFSPAPTILLTYGTHLSVSEPVFIEGPATYELEVDASGNDPSPTFKNFDGTRVFALDNGTPDDLSDISISNLTIMGGDVQNQGGGILNKENLVLTNVTLKKNAASNDGGGLFSQYGTLDISGSTFGGPLAEEKNQAADDGGAIFIDTGWLDDVVVATISNSTITGNQAGDKGAGIVNRDADLLIEYSTITNNLAASTKGSGLAHFSNTNTETTFHSTILSGNSINDVDFLGPQGGSSGGINNIVSLGYNLVGMGTNGVLGSFNQPGDQILILDPMLEPLANTGGPTLTHQPMIGSPVVDAGDPTAVPGVDGVPITDQRGQFYNRVFDGDGDETATIDIGAYELQGVTYTVTTLVDENDGDYSAPSSPYSPGFSLREAIALANAGPLPDFIQFELDFGDEPPPGPWVLQMGSGQFMPDTPDDLIITDSLSIAGLGQSLLTIDGSGIFGSRIFTIDDGDPTSEIDVNITDMRMKNSLSFAEGGVIRSSENLNLENIFFETNGTFGDGLSGGILFQEGGSLILRDSTITGSVTNGIAAHGGAIYAVDAEVALHYTSLSGNSAHGSNSNGGGLHILNGNLTLDQSTITGNSTPAGSSTGGGIYLNQSSAVLTGSNVSGNLTTGSHSGGGGIYAVSSDLTLEQSSVIGLNRTFGTVSPGGGIYILGGNLDIRDSLLFQNSTSGLSAPGGGIASSGTEVSITASTLRNNYTSGDDADGGGIYHATAPMMIRDSTLVGNFTSGTDSAGGGIASATDLSGSQTTMVLNSTLSGNSSAVRGGGIYNAGGLMRIEHSTITENAAPLGLGGGVASFHDSATTLTQVGSTIIAANTDDDVDSVLGITDNSFQSLGYNMIGNGLAAPQFDGPGDQTGIVDPLLGPLFFNGGLTLTHAPLEGSPAIGAGDPNFNENDFTPPLQLDQRQLARVQADRIDVGAVESPFTPSIASDFNVNGFVEGSDFLKWQRGFGAGPGASKSDGDANVDGYVDGTDLAIWQSQFGDGPVESQASAVFAASSSAVVAALVVEEPVQLEPAAVLTASPASAGLSAGRLSETKVSAVAVDGRIANARQWAAGWLQQAPTARERTLDLVSQWRSAQQDRLSWQDHAFDDLMAGTMTHDWNRGLKMVAANGPHAWHGLDHSSVDDAERGDGAERLPEDQVFAMLGLDG